MLFEIIIILLSEWSLDKEGVCRYNAGKFLGEDRKVIYSRRWAQGCSWVLSNRTSIWRRTPFSYSSRMCDLKGYAASVNWAASSTNEGVRGHSPHASVPPLEDHAPANRSCSWCPHRPLTQLAVATRADLNLRVAIIAKRRPKKLGNGWPLVRFRMEYLVTPLILALSIDVAHHEALSKAMSGILGSGANA